MHDIAPKLFACISAALLSSACVVNYYDTGFTSIDSRKRDNLIVDQNYSFVVDRLTSYMTQQGMFNLQGSSRQASTFTAQPSSFGKIASASIWINEGRPIAKYKGYFSCRNNAPITISAGTLYVVEKNDKTEIQYISSVAGATLRKTTSLSEALNEDSVDVNCSVNPGLVKYLAKDAGII